MEKSQHKWPWAETYLLVGNVNSISQSVVDQVLQKLDPGLFPLIILVPHIRCKSHLCQHTIVLPMGRMLKYCCCCSVIKSYPTLCHPMDYSMPGFPVLHYLLEFAQTHAIEPMVPSNHLIICHPLLLLPSVFPSIRVFSNELALCIRWPKYWSFSFSINPSNEYSGLISFSADWFDLSSQESPPAPQFKSINSSVLNFLYDTTLTSMDDYWKNHSFDYIYLC